MTWHSLLLAPVVIIYLLLMFMLTVYVMNYLYLAFVSMKSHRTQRAATPEEPISWPRVTVQLPVYNELSVAARLVQAAAELEYPPGLLEIQVLDDSTDETVAVVADEVNRQRLHGVDIVHLRRSSRAGFKAGALAEGLAAAKGDFVAIFDADFLPAPDFLRRMMSHFDHERVAFVQARWGHLNREYSLLTVLQSLSLDAHFAIDQRARASAGHFFNFNGTAGIWRKAAILDAGGWQADTLTEDLDLSYRAFLRGWTARYADEVEAAGELPVSFNAFRRQQHRWARGSMECAIRFLPRIWRAEGPLLRKLVASLHLTGYATHFLTLGLILVFPLMLALSVYYPTLLDPRGFGLLANLMFFVPSVYFVIGQKLLGRRWLPQLPVIMTSTVLASGLMLNTVSAALEIFRRKVIPFERTPKYGILRRGQDWRATPYRVKTESVVFLELGLAGFTLLTALLAWEAQHWLMMTYSLLFSTALVFASGFTLTQALSQRLRAQSRV
jgi:cellulose synthase/poly-beta-1,6-N-acetylglucosamine synthase-like glycosyltransferase